MNKRKIAVVLFNLGGPDSLDAVRQFLFNLFYDPAIIRLPNPFRWIIAKIISTARYKKSQKIYELVGSASPILRETKKQSEALGRLLAGESDEYKIFTVMRYAEPRAETITPLVVSYEPDEIILLPLYPQFSSTTTASSVEEFKKILARTAAKNIVVKTVCCYNNDDDFISAHVSLLEPIFSRNQSARILFSAHGLPQKVVDDGDPYQAQIEKTAELIIDKLKQVTGISNIDNKISYQSRVGKMEWLKPYTEDEIILAGTEGKDLIIVPIAFVSEHVETLVELDIEYKEIAKKFGINYFRVPALGDNDSFIKCLRNQIIWATDALDPQKNLCDKKFTDCPCNK